MDNKKVVIFASPGAAEHMLKLAKTDEEKEKVKSTIVTGDMFSDDGFMMADAKRFMKFLKSYATSYGFKKEDTKADDGSERKDD